MPSLSLIAATSQQVASTTKRSVKIRELAACLKQLTEDEIEIGVLYLAGETRQGKIGIGYAALRGAATIAPVDTSQLRLTHVDAAFDRLTNVAGPGSTGERARQLNELFATATAAEQEFLVKLISGELRQGALGGLMVEAIAVASGIAIEEARRAAMYAPHLGAVARIALHGERAALLEFQLATLSPVAPMLAESAGDVADALEQLGGEAAFEWKIDGARIQVHKHGDDIRIYTRSLNDVAHAIPEVIEAIRSLPARELVLDGEVVALSSSGDPLPFQVTMRRFGRKLDIDALRRELPVYPFFFDCLKADDASLADRPASERFATLARIVPETMRIPRMVTANLEAAQAFYAQALAKGHEGVMAKSLAAPYEAGKRGASWLKIKRVHTLDLVVLAAEWGNGRRSGKLSNLHLGARDATSGEFVMLGKTFKGLTDALLEWQTAEFLKRETHRDRMTVYVRPELVVEIAFNDIQASSQYPGGYALRFARVKRYRPDKPASAADTLDTIRRLYDAQSGVEARERFSKP